MRWTPSTWMGSANRDLDVGAIDHPQYEATAARQGERSEGAWSPVGAGVLQERRRGVGPEASGGSMQSASDTPSSQCAKGVAKPLPERGEPGLRRLSPRSPSADPDQRSTSVGTGRNRPQAPSVAESCGQVMGLSLELSSNLVFDLGGPECDQAAFRCSSFASGGLSGTGMPSS